MEVIPVVLRVACALLAWLFVVRYALTTFEDTEEGKHLMGFTLITAIFMTLASIVVIFGPFPYIGQVGTILYAWLAYLLYRRNAIFHKRQKERNEEEARRIL